MYSLSDFQEDIPQWYHIHIHIHLHIPIHIHVLMILSPKHFFPIPATNTTKYKKIERYLVTLSLLHFTFNLTVLETTGIFHLPGILNLPFAIFPVMSGSSHGWKTRGAGLRDAPKITEIVGNLGCRLFLAANRINHPCISDIVGWAPITLDLCSTNFLLPIFLLPPKKTQVRKKKRY